MGGIGEHVAHVQSNGRDAECIENHWFYVRFAICVGTYDMVEKGIGSGPVSCYVILEGHSTPLDCSHL